MTQYPDPAGAASSFLEQHGELLGAMQMLRMRDVAEDERTAALNDEWDACMQEAGYQLAWPEYGRPDPSPLFGLDLAIRTPPGGTAGEPQPDVPTSEIPIEERYLVGSLEEREIALADFDCRQATDYEQRLAEIQIDLEKGFVAAHREELDEMLAAVELAD